MNEEVEQKISKIERLIKKYILYNSLLTIIKMPIEQETRIQCLIELRKAGFEIREPSTVEFRKIRTELKKISQSVKELKNQLPPMILHFYRSRVSWTS